MAFEVTLRTARQESEKHVVDASGYGVDGQFTTFWRKAEGNNRERVASFKTNLIQNIREVQSAQP